MKTGNRWLLLTGIVLLFASCNQLQITVHNKVALKAVKTVSFDRIEVRSLTFDPFLQESLRAFLEFEFLKAGYTLVKKVESPSNEAAPIPDADVTLMFLHNRYFRNISEKDNMTVCLEMTGPTNERLCSVVYSDTSGKNLLNTQELQKAVAVVVRKIRSE